jgi:hypothetical protein
MGGRGHGSYPWLPAHNHNTRLNDGIKAPSTLFTQRESLVMRCISAAPRNGIGKYNVG